MNIRNLFAATGDRQRWAAQARRVQAARAIEIIEQHLSNDMKINDLQQKHLNMLRARVRYPDESLQQIGKVIGLSKDTYAARLRNALEYADRLAGGGIAC